MKLPRDVSGDTVIALLRRHGYEVSHQKGSHVRMKHNGKPAHHVTVPKRNPIDVGRSRRS